MASLPIPDRPSPVSSPGETMSLWRTALETGAKVLQATRP